VITDALLFIVGAILDGFALVLPEVSIPGWSTVMGFADDLSGYLFAMDGILPMTEYVSTVRWIVVVWLPGFFAFLLARWVWKYVPVLGKG
jgi:hypothetical protein